MKSSIAGLVGILALAFLTAGHFLGLGWTVAAGMALAVVFGYGWPRYLGIPAKKTLGTVTALTGVAAALVAGRTSEFEGMVWTPLLIAVAFGIVMVVQVIRGTGQKRRLESILGSSAGVAIAGLGSGWVASLRFLEDPAMTLIVAISAAVAIVTGFLRWPERIVAPVTIALGALAGPLAAILLADDRIIPAAVLGVVISAVIAAFHRLRTFVGNPGGIMGLCAAGLAPVLSVGALMYFLQKILFG